MLADIRSQQAKYLRGSLERASLQYLLCCAPLPDLFLLRRPSLLLWSRLSFLAPSGSLVCPECCVWFQSTAVYRCKHSFIPKASCQRQKWLFPTHTFGRLKRLPFQRSRTRASTSLNMVFNPLGEKGFIYLQHCSHLGEKTASLTHFSKHQQRKES